VIVEKDRALNEANQLIAAKQAELEKANGAAADKEKEIGELKALAVEAAASAQAQADEAAGKVKALADEAADKAKEWAEEKAALEQELGDAKKTIELDMPLITTLHSLKVGDADFGSVFIETARDASADDLDLLGKLMVAMRHDAIKASDKRMLMDILKRFVK
jgi:hypothetical protein